MEEHVPTLADVQRLLYKAMNDLNAKRIGVNHANAIANMSLASVAAVRAECAFIDLLGGKRTGMIPEEDARPTRHNVTPTNRWLSRPAVR